MSLSGMKVSRVGTREFSTFHLSLILLFVYRTKFEQVEWLAINALSVDSVPCVYLPQTYEIVNWPLVS